MSYGVDDALGGLRDLGRRSPPGLFLLGAFALGLATGLIARNLAHEPAGEGRGQVRAAGQRSGVMPPPAFGADVDVGDCPIPAGHAAYGAPAGLPHSRGI